MPPVTAELLVTYARAARDLQGAPSDQDRLLLGSRLALELIPGCRHAGIARRRQRRAVNVADTDDVVVRADAYADRFGGGPTADALSSDAAVVLVDLHSESRWPSWTAYVRDTLGIAAVLCVPLRATGRAIGVLTLYFDTPVTEAGDVCARSEALGTHLALALDSAGTIEHQVVALEHRTEIGQAQGILMARSGIAADAAFAYLQRMSQDNNQKLHTVAADVVRQRGPVTNPAAASPNDRHRPGCPVRSGKRPPPLPLPTSERQRFGRSAPSAVSQPTEPGPCESPDCPAT